MYMYTGSDINYIMQLHSNTDIGMFVSSVLIGIKIEYVVQTKKQSSGQPPAINVQNINVFQ